MDIGKHGMPQTGVFSHRMSSNYLPHSAQPSKGLFAVAAWSSCSGSACDTRLVMTAGVSRPALVYCTARAET